MVKKLSEFPNQARETIKRELEIGQVWRNDHTGKEVLIRNIYRKQERILAKPQVGDPFMISFKELKGDWSKL